MFQMDASILIGLLESAPEVTGLKPTMMLIATVLEVYTSILSLYADEIYLFDDSLVSRIISKFDHEFQMHYQFYILHYYQKFSTVSAHYTTQSFNPFQVTPFSSDYSFSDKENKFHDLNPRRMHLINFLIHKRQRIRFEVNQEIESILSFIESPLADFHKSPRLKLMNTNWLGLEQTFLFK